MSNIHVEVNDYLDLYLYADRIGDTTWKLEIIEKLKNIQNSTKKTENKSLDSRNLWEQYKKVNEQILSIYDQLRAQTSNIELHEKIGKLKEQRLFLGQQIRSINQQHAIE
ncbi:hypothetical protein [Bacillus sp. 03113]|uniref:hypothetical protein n=1 Tax=Bacillus sp. 03113 TaxID=2578211 RepID=UPI001141DAE7|nr:hypothetical protein [Bacillus sp. 03113]